MQDILKANRVIGILLILSVLALAGCGEGKSPSSLPMPSGTYTSGLSNLTFNGDYVTATSPLPPFSITSKFRRINDSEAEFTDLKTGKVEVDKFRYIPEADLIILGKEGIEFTKVKR